MSLIKNLSKQQEVATITDGGITIRGEKKERRFSHFRSSVSADLNSVEITVNSRTIIRADGVQLNAKDQLDLLASYQTSQIIRSVPRIIESVDKFLSNPDFSVNVRYVPSTVDPTLKAKDWVKNALYHALCGIGTSFQHNGINYHVIVNTEIHTLSGMDAMKVINGDYSINLKGNTGDVISPKKNISMLVDPDIVSEAMNKIILALSLSVEDGCVYTRGIKIRQWIQNETISTLAVDKDLSDVQINL